MRPSSSRSRCPISSPEPRPDTAARGSTRALSLLALAGLGAAVLACGGGTPEAPPPQPTNGAPTPAEPEPAEAPAAPAPGDAPEGAEDPDRFKGWFPAQHAEVDAVRTELAAVTDAAGLLALWVRALELTASMADPLNSRFDSGSGQFAGGDPEALFAEQLPYAELGFYAEGTWAQLELRSDWWLDAAAKTSDAVDDRFIQLMVDSYGNASGRGWATWQARNWDYGGCSPLGSGLHKGLLLQTDALMREGAPPVPAAVQKVAGVRRDVLSDIEQPTGPGEFPYCDSEKFEPTPVAMLEAEVQAILSEVALEPDERKMLGARIRTGFGL